MAKQSIDMDVAATEISVLQAAKMRILMHLKGAHDPAQDAIDAFSARRRGTALHDWRVVRVQTDIAALDERIATLRAGTQP